MTDTLRQAARATTYILDNADRVRLLLKGDEPRSNTLGILANPDEYLAALNAARYELDRAIAIHVTTNWPSIADYHAL